MRKRILALTLKTISPAFLFLKGEDKTTKETTMKTNMHVRTRVLSCLLRLGGAAALAVMALGSPLASAAELPTYEAQPSVNVAPASPRLTAVDPLAWAISGDVTPARPFLYSVDKD